MANSSPAQIVDVAFPVSGRALPLDHGYLLFSALSGVIPALHAEPTWGVHPVQGSRDGNELLLDDRSRVKLRMPLAQISEVLPLAGNTLDIAGGQLRVDFLQHTWCDSKRCWTSLMILALMPKGVEHTIRSARITFPRSDSCLDAERR